MSKGKFIVFEGIDGCGKSTQVWKFAQYLAGLSKYHHVLVTREPYKSREIREILKTTESPETRAEKLTELFVKDRADHVQESILPNLEKGTHVISDRYKLSTMVYQSVQGMPMDKLIELHHGFPIPDLIFIVDLSAEVAAERMKSEGRENKEHKFESSLDFQKKLRQRYLEMREHFPNEKIIIIDGNTTVSAIHSKIVEEYENLKV